MLISEKIPLFTVVTTEESATVRGGTNSEKALRLYNLKEPYGVTGNDPRTGRLTFVVMEEKEPEVIHDLTHVLGIGI
jgi:hypothetical protein